MLRFRVGVLRFRVGVLRFRLRVLRFRLRVLRFRLIVLRFRVSGCFVLRSSFSSASLSILPELTRDCINIVRWKVHS